MNKQRGEIFKHIDWLQSQYERMGFLMSISFSQVIPNLTHKKIVFNGRRGCVFKRTC